MSMFRSVSALFLISSLSFAQAAAPQKPFPQEIVYSSIQQPSLSERERNKITTDFYDYWKSTYLKQYDFTNGAVDGSFSGYVVEAETNPAFVEGVGETISQSEAHGWGMIIAALMAGWDGEAKTIFDGMYRVHRNWPSADHEHLMSWAIPKDGSLTSDKRRPSASDGDMDVAYALLLAAEQWGGSPEGVDISYFEAAVEIIRALEENNILYAPESSPNAVDFPRLGIGHNSGNYWDVRATRSSDFMLSHFRVFHEARMSDPAYKAGTVNHGVANVWKAVEESCISIVSRLQDPATGLMPDFMGNRGGDFSQNISTFKGISDEPDDNPGENDDCYWYNACRFPWRFAQGYIHDGIVEAKSAVEPIGEWLLTADEHQEWGYFQLYLVGAGYSLDGWILEGANYYEKAFVAPFMTALALGTNDWYFNILWESVTEFQWPDESSPHYYDNSVGLLNILLLTGNWWRPSPSGNVSISSAGTLKQSAGLTTLPSGLRIRGAEAGSRIGLFDLKGRAVASVEANSRGEAELYAEGSGIYIVKGQGFSFKTLIQK